MTDTLDLTIGPAPADIRSQLPYFLRADPDDAYIRTMNALVRIGPRAETRAVKIDLDVALLKSYLDFVATPYTDPTSSPGASWHVENAKTFSHTAKTADIVMESGGQLYLRGNRSLYFDKDIKWILSFADMRTNVSRLEIEDCPRHWAEHHPDTVNVLYRFVDEILSKRMNMLLQGYRIPLLISRDFSAPIRHVRYRRVHEGVHRITIECDNDQTCHLDTPFSKGELSQYARDSRTQLWNVETTDAFLGEFVMAALARAAAAANLTHPPILWQPNENRTVYLRQMLRETVWYKGKSLWIGNFANEFLFLYTHQDYARSMREMERHVEKYGLRLSQKGAEMAFLMGHMRTAMQSMQVDHNYARTCMVFQPFQNHELRVVCQVHMTHRTENVYREGVVELSDVKSFYYPGNLRHYPEHDRPAWLLGKTVRPAMLGVTMAMGMTYHVSQIRCITITNAAKLGGRECYASSAVAAGFAPYVDHWNGLLSPLGIDDIPQQITCLRDDDVSVDALPEMNLGTPAEPNRTFAPFIDFLGASNVPAPSMSPETIDEPLDDNVFSDLYPEEVIDIGAMWAHTPPKQRKMGRLQTLQTYAAVSRGVDPENRDMIRGVPPPVLTDTSQLRRKEPRPQRIPAYVAARRSALEKAAADNRLEHATRMMREEAKLKATHQHEHQQRVVDEIRRIRAEAARERQRDASLMRIAQKAHQAADEMLNPLSATTGVSKTTDAATNTLSRHRTARKLKF